MNLLWQWQWIGILTARLTVGILFAISGAGKLLDRAHREQMRQTLIAAHIPTPRIAAIFVSSVEFFTVLVGLRFMWTLLFSALIIIPAATARQLTTQVTRFVAVATSTSLVSVVSGFLISTPILKTTMVGPVIVIVSVLLFAGSLLNR